MSYRKAKLLLEQKKLQQSTQTKSKEDTQEQQQPMQQKAKKNVFAAFEDDDDDEEQQKQTNVTKNENKQQEKDSESKAKKNKKKKKKNKEGTEKVQKVKEQEQIDVEKVFKQVGIQYKGNQQQAKEAEDWEKILHINQSKFNYEKELRRHFGNVGSLNEEKGDDPEMTKKQQRYHKHLKKAMKKSVLSPGVKDVFLIRQKFQVDRDENKIKFMPSKKYDQYQAQYDTIRNSNDINALFMFMQTHPEHVDSIYAVGEFLRLQGNYRDADNLIQRVIYIYQMAAPFDLNQFIKEDFVKKEIVYQTFSISLFMSLFKFMDILGKKGCFRTALEYNKFLLKININDPTACILCIDFNSISAKCNDYLLDFVKNFGSYVGVPKSSLYLLPNFIYSVALAKYYLETTQKQQKGLVVEQTDKKALVFTEQDWKSALVLPSDDSFTKQNSKTLILRAILVYPKLVIEVANKNQYGKQFLNYGAFVGNQKKSYKDILAHQFWSIIPSSYSYNFLRLQNLNDSNGLDKVLEVYVERSKILWKSNEIMLWVKGALGFLLNKIDSKQFQYQAYLEKLCTEESGGMQIPFQLRRYSNISKHNFSDRVERIDLANIQDNQRQQAPRNENRMSLEGNPLTMFLNSLLPWVNLPNAGHEDPDMPDIQDDDDD